MMHLYSALVCTAVHPKHFTIMRGVSPQPPPVYSIHLDDAMAATRQRRQCTRHTAATGGAERESLSQSRELVQAPESPPPKTKNCA